MNGELKNAFETIRVYCACTESCEVCEMRDMCKNFMTTPLSWDLEEE